MVEHVATRQIREDQVQEVLILQTVQEADDMGRGGVRVGLLVVMVMVALLEELHGTNLIPWVLAVIPVGGAGCRGIIRARVVPTAPWHGLDNNWGTTPQGGGCGSITFITISSTTVSLLVVVVEVGDHRGGKEDADIRLGLSADDGINDITGRYQ